MRREFIFNYELRVIQEEETSTTFIMMRDIQNSRIVVDARLSRNDKTLVLEIDTQSGQALVRSLS